MQHQEQASPRLLRVRMRILNVETAATILLQIGCQGRSIDMQKIFLRTGNQGKIIKILYFEIVLFLLYF